MNKRLISLCGFALIGFTSTVASATTITFKSSNGGIFPYEMTLNGGTTLIAMDCLNDTRKVSVNETWNVTDVNLLNFTGSTDGATASELDTQAWLDSLYGTSYTTKDGKATNTNIQNAIWAVQDSGDLSGLSKIEKDLLADAATFVGSNPSSSLFFAQFDVYVPTSNRSGWTDGKPQEFIRFTPATVVTPEPSSLMLLGTGILGGAGFLRRRILGATRRS